MARKTKRRRKRNPKGYPKTARGRAWRRLVKKHGVKKAAAIKRRRKRGRRRTRTNIATNPRRRARRRTTTARRRSRTRRRRTYRRNPTVVGTAKSLATGVLKKGFLMDVAAGFGGMFGALLGEGIAGKIKGEGKVLNANEKLLGNVGGSVLVGTLVAVVGKDMRRGAIAASTGVAYGLFKRFYGDIREALGGKLVGLDLPAMGDYVELPAGTAGMGSYVEFPAHAGVGQFLPPAEMDPGAGQFIPSEEIETSI